MRKVKKKSAIAIVLVLVMSWSFFGIDVSAAIPYTYIANGDHPEYWGWDINRLNNSSNLSSIDGPSSGHGGSGNFFYFTNGSNNIEIGSAMVHTVCKLKDIANIEDLKKIHGKRQLKVDFKLWFHGYGDSDYLNAEVRIGNYPAGADYYNWGYVKQSFIKNGITGGREWREHVITVGDNTLSSDITIDDTTTIVIVLYAGRKSGSDLDVYLDDIQLRVYDGARAAIANDESKGKLVDQIIDKNNMAVPLKAGVNWVNPGDTIKGTLAFSEDVRVCTLPQMINTNVFDANKKRIKGYMVSSKSMPNYGFGVPVSIDFSQAFEYRIPLNGAAEMEGSNINFYDVGTQTVKIWYVNSVFNRIETLPCGPFDYPPVDLGDNYGIENGVNGINAIFNNYNVKLDSVVPEIVTEAHAFDAYDPGRSAVDIVVRETHNGKVQSPLTVSYKWTYIKSNGSEETQTGIALTYNDPIPAGETSKDHSIRINIPTEDKSPTSVKIPYQKLKLTVTASDAARNESVKEFVVNQLDESAPVIELKDSTADNVPENLTSLGYAKTRTVTFSIDDSNSGVKEVRYLWSTDALVSGSSITNPVTPTEAGGKIYKISGGTNFSDEDIPYYLHIKAVNNTDTSGSYSKAFYFDNEAPRVSRTGTASSMNPTELKYQAVDRALKNKFLYAVVAKDDSITPPIIGGEIQNNGIWLAKSYDNTGGAASIKYADFAGYITGSGDYKLVAGFYDEKNNYSQIEEAFAYDLTAPKIDSFTGDTATYKKSHQVTVKVTDNLSPIKEVAYQWVPEGSLPVAANYTAASIGANGYIINDSGKDGTYSIHLKLTDDKNNVKEKTLSKNDGSTAYFHFDNSSPTVTLTYNTSEPVQTVRFSYANLTDTYSKVTLFQYGLTTEPNIEPSEWIDITPVESENEVKVIYPDAFETDGPRYLVVKLQDIPGNEQIIFEPVPFQVDVTKPSGKVYFNDDYTNKLDTLLNLEIDELKSIGSETSFKTFLSSVGNDLEDAEKLSDPGNWKDIKYRNGTSNYEWSLTDSDDAEQKVYVRFMDEAGNLSDIYEAGIILDRTAPTGVIDKDIADPTKENVTATLTVTDNFEGSQITILNNAGANTYTFNRNGEFEFIFLDEAGNKGRALATVSNIDRNSPTGTITYSHPRNVWTNQSITATLHLDDLGATVTSVGGATHTFDENGTFTFSYEDALGNQGSITAEVKNIDKTAPEGHILQTFSNTAPVTVYLAVYEPVTVTNNGGSFRHMFDENGEFTFTFKDKAGNSGQATAVVNTITSSQKYVDVVYSESGLTNGSVDVDFKPFSGLSNITTPTVTEDVYYPDKYTYSFTENGDKPIAIKILSGAEENSVRTVVGSVYNIDKTPPGAEVYISTESLTNQSVTVTLLTQDDKGKTVTIENNNGESEYVFAENGSFTFDFKDEAGNIGHKTITVSNIDKTAPVAGVTYTKDNAKNTKTARISFTGETETVEILNNNGSDTFEFIENGAFTFRFADQAGNTGELTVLVDNISEGISAGEIKYYIEGVEIADPTVGTTNKNITAVLSFAEGSDTYTIKNNDGSSYIFDRNGEFTFVFEDSKGNRGFKTAKVGMIDKEAPKLDILANTVKATNQDVSITIDYSDNKGIASIQHNLEAENITSVVGGRITYLCKANKLIQVKVIDTAGNETYKEFNVNYIDREAPIGNISYSQSSKTNQDVKAVLSLNEPGTVQNNNGKMEYIFTENGSFEFEAYDMAGNKARNKDGEKVIAAVNWIDKLPPVVTLEYSKTALTNQPVEVTVKANEDIIVLNNGGAVKRVFDENGTYTFNVRDIAGNQVSIEAKVGNIDTVKPEILLKGLKNTLIAQNGVYTEAGYGAADKVDGDLTSKVTVSGSVDPKVPGKYLLTYRVADSAGNASEAVRTVNVVSPDTILLLLNGIPAEGKEMTISSKSIKVSCFGNEGGFSIKWAEGKRTQAFFKSEGFDVAPEATVELVNNSWYTFFIQDRERKTQGIQVLVNE